MKVDTTYLLKRRRDKLEQLKFDQTKPKYVKQQHMLHTEEMVDILLKISTHAYTAKNLAYKFVYDELWWPKDNTLDSKIVKYDTYFNENAVNVTVEDKELFTQAIESKDLKAMTVVMDKYLTYDVDKHVTIRDLALSDEYIDLYKAKYDAINIKLDEEVARIKRTYDEDTAKAATADEYNKYIIPPYPEYLNNSVSNAGTLIEGLSRDA